MWVQTMLVVAGGYIGAVVGGGFATGRELLQFFLLSGGSSPVPPAAAGIGFAIAGPLLMGAVAAGGEQSQREIGRIFCVGKPGRSLVDLVLVVFLWTVLAVVLSAAAALAEVEGLLAVVGWLGGATIISLVVLAGRGATTAVNGLLVLVLVGTILRVNSTLPPPAGGDAPTGEFSVAPLLYVSYNLLFVLPVFPRCVGRGPKGAAIAGAALGGTFLAVVCWATIQIMLRTYRHVAGAEVPLRVALALTSPAAAVVYPIVAGLALITTGVALTHGVACRVDGYDEPRARSVCVVMIPALVVSRIALSDLVAILYPFMAWVSLLLWFQLGRNALRRVR